jgi:HPt (histidine-containing phosphotransfer) domain-containing protein
MKTPGASRDAACTAQQAEPAASCEQDRPEPVDRNRLLEIYEEQSFVEDLLRMFVTYTRVDLVDLEEACAGSDCAQIAVLAHRIKGAAANVSAEPLRSDAARLEALGRTGQLAGVSDSLTQLRADFEALDRFVGGVPAPEGKE